jgi:hypothetical protein
MKFIPEFKLGFPLSWKYYITPVHDILLGLMTSFLRIKLML